MSDRTQVYFRRVGVPVYIIRWSGGKYIFRKEGLYDIPSGLADVLVINDSSRFSTEPFEEEKVEEVPQKKAVKKVASKKITGG